MEYCTVTKTLLTTSEVRDYWDFGFCSSSGILKNVFRKLDLFPSTGEEVGEMYSVLDPLERANLLS
jgi:hypothetical protein